MVPLGSKHLGDAVQSALHHWQQSTKGQEAPAFTIALSRQAGTQGPRIARAVADKLGWTVFDRELLQKVAEEMGLRTSLLDSVDERRKGWLQESMEAFFTAHPVTGVAFVKNLVEVVLSLGSKGNCVIVGRGAAHLLPAVSTLRVRLVGPVEDRVENIRQRFGISHQEAARWVEHTDHERTQFAKEFFKKDVGAPEAYDMVLNVARFSVNECADLILEALKLRQQHAKKG